MIWWHYNGACHRKHFKNLNLLQHVCCFLTILLILILYGTLTLILRHRTMVSDLWARADNATSHHSRSRICRLPESPASTWGKCRPGSWRHHCAARGLWKLPGRVRQIAADLWSERKCCLRRRADASACLHNLWVLWVSMKNYHKEANSIIEAADESSPK